MTNTIMFAPQGIRQMASLPEANGGQVLKPGSSFILHSAENDGVIVQICEGTIGIVHKENGDCTVSVIRDDCKAARKALHKEETLEQLIKNAEETYFTDEPQLRYSDLTDAQKSIAVKQPHRPRVRINHGY